MVDFPVNLTETVNISESFSSVRVEVNWDHEADFTINTNVLEQNPIEIFQDETNQRLDATISRNNSNDGMSKGINGLLSAIEFLVEFDIDVQSLMDAASQSNNCYVILSGSDSSASSSASQSFLGLSWVNDSGANNNQIQTLVGEGIAPINGADQLFAILISVTRLGIKIERTDANNAVIGIYSNATKNPLDPADLLDSLTVPLTALANLQFFKILNQAGGNSTNVTQQFTNFIRLMYSQSNAKIDKFVELQDEVNVSDSVAIMGDFTINLPETVLVSDNIDPVKDAIRTVNDTVTIVDAIDENIGNFETLVDTVPVNDSLSKLGEFVRELPDSIILTQGLTIQTGDAIEIEEETMIMDFLFTKADKFRELNDTVIISDVVTPVRNIPILLVDNVIILDQIDRLYAAVRSLNEPDILVNDSVSKQLNKQRSLEDETEITDSLQTKVDFLRIFFDFVGISDMIGVAVQGIITKEVSSNLCIQTESESELNI